MSWYDTREGIQKAVKKGIPGLIELSDARRKAGYDRKERLEQWCVVGLFTLDTCGNFDKIIKNAPRNSTRRYEVRDVMTHKEAFAFIIGSWTSTGCELPPIVETCDRCLHSWDMQNIEDHHARHSEDDPHRHENCHTLAVIQNELKFFTEILDASEMPYTEMRIIPNEYHPIEYKNPWFIVLTEWGLLRIGCRRHVINISWSGTRINHNGDVTFKDENVTTGRTFVHAHGKDKAVEYLKKLSRGN